MLNKKWLIVCLSVLCMLSSSLSAFATYNKVTISLSPEMGVDMAMSDYLLISKGEFIFGGIENTSSDQTLRWELLPLPSGWCGTVFPVDQGTVEPGKTINLSWTDLEGSGYRIALYGPGTGTAELITSLWVW